MFKDKLKAASIHLTISAIVLFVFLSIVFSVWYPQPYATISGIVSILLILVGVDLILGPLLTFVVFKKGKASLKFDLFIIASAQIVALLYGAFTVYQGHPAYVVYAVDRFELIPAQEAFPENAQYEEFKISKLWLPKLAYAKKPEDSESKNKLLFEVLAGKPDIERRSEYYEPIDKFSDKIFSRGVKPEVIRTLPENKQKLDAFLNKYGEAANDYAFLPLIGKEKDVLWAWNRKSGEPVGILDVNPWALEQVANAQ